jgi:hypothetical protein
MVTVIGWIEEGNMDKELCKQYSFPTTVYDNDKRPHDATVVNCSQCPHQKVCDSHNVIYKIEIPDEVSEVN